jgi:hypothetical protein
MICPFLGLKNDPSTSLSYASVLNDCHLAEPSYTPKLDHQEAFCLAGTHETCPVFLRQQVGPLPREIRLPRSKPVWGANQWKMVLAVSSFLLLAVIGWQVFARGLISTSTDGHNTSLGGTGNPQSSVVFLELTSTPSNTASSSPTATPTHTPTFTTTPTASSTSTRYYWVPSITPTETSRSVEIAWTSTPPPTDTPFPMDTLTLTDTPVPTDTFYPTNITIPTQTGTSTPTDTPTSTDTPVLLDTPTPEPLEIIFIPLAV